MHKSRLAGMIIDCRTDNLVEAADFWSKALGLAVLPQTDPSEEKYIQLDTGPDGLHLEVQKVAHESRVHIDIESDNIEAEVERLERLGARRIEKIKTWWVMEAPTGQRFCVVRPQRADFASEANVWDET